MARYAWWSAFSRSLRHPELLPRRFEWRLEAKASRTLRKYGFCSGQEWTTEEGKAAALKEHRLFSADEVNVATLAAAGATLLSPFPGQGRPGVKVGLRARAAQ